MKTILKSRASVAVLLTAVVAIIAQGALAISEESLQETTPDAQTTPPLAEKTDDMTAGRELMETRCSACHIAPRPQDHALSEWPAILNDMGARAFLRPSEVDLIKNYLEESLNPQASPASS